MKTSYKVSILKTAFILCHLMFILTAVAVWSNHGKIDNRTSTEINTSKKLSNANQKTRNQSPYQLNRTGVRSAQEEQI